MLVLRLKVALSGGAFSALIYTRQNQRRIGSRPITFFDAWYFSLCS
jgi:hypothetical protein